MCKVYTNLREMSQRHIKSSILCDCQVWNIERAMLLRVFQEEHEEQVNHCEFTHTMQRLLLVTCSNDKIMNAKVRESVLSVIFLIISLFTVM